MKFLLRTVCYLGIGASLTLAQIGCEKKGSTSPARTAASGLQAMPDSFAVNGSLNIPTDAPAGASAEGKAIQLLSDSGQVVAEAVTGAAGSFQIQVGAATGLKLQEAAKSTVAMPQLMRIKSLFLTGGTSLAEDQDALGVLEPLIIDPKNLEPLNGGYALDTGNHEAKKVGAIYGKITLETGGDPTGIDVYVPGTTYIAKTDKDGQFLLGFLPPGTFQIRADKDGFNSVEWPRVVVKKEQTTHLPDGVMSISVGPKIETFELDSLSQADGIAVLRLRIKNASKYRVSTIQDFSDTQFNPLDAAVPEFTLKLPLAVGVRYVKIYLEAADSGGLSANSTLTIDREAPSKGSISAITNNGFIHSMTVPLAISAEGATKMKLSETLAGLDTASWVAYAASYNFSLQSATNGNRKIFAAFADDADNIYGIGGEIQTSFVLDTIAPADGVIALLPPESPTGAFNTPLAWIAAFPEAVTYEIDVASDVTFNTILRQMTSTQANTIINPPLASQGTYYWRVRAIDAAGNQSSWVPSGVKNSFKVVILAESYQAQFSLSGDPGNDSFFAKSLADLGDLNGDGKSELAVAVPDTNLDNCSDCGAVKIFDPGTRKFLATLSEELPNTATYGHKMVMCDMNGDGRKELVVSAPARNSLTGTTTYHNIGAVYVYETQNFSRLSYYSPPLPNTNVPGFQWCSTWDYNTNTCSEYGWSYWPETVPSVPWSDGYFYGWDLTCIQNASGASQLAVGAPNFSTSNDWGNGYRVGVVDILSMSGNNLVKTQSISNSVTTEEGYGAAVTFLNNYNCGTTTAPTLAVGAPRRQVTGTEVGGVDLYQLSSGSWTKCGSINADPMNDPTWSYFGSRLFNLGDVVKNNDGTVELAIATSSWNGGLVKFFDGNDGLQKKSYRIDDWNFTKLGYQVAAAGDFNGDGMTEIAIGIPGAYVNGKWSSGQVSIFQWSQLTNDSAADPGITPLLTIQGKPEDGSNLGADFIPVRTTSSIHSAFKSAYISRPGLSINGEWSVGALESFAKIKMAPTSPYRVTGTNSGAHFGASISSAPDLDKDNVADFLIGQPGGRCEGRPFGAVSLFSVLDNAVTYSICSNPQNMMMNGQLENLGRQVKYLSKSYSILFSNYDTAFAVPNNYLFNLTDSSQIGTGGWSTGLKYSPTFWGGFIISEPWSSSWNDVFMVGTKDTYNNDSFAQTGSVSIYDSTGSSPKCRIFGKQQNGQFGFHSAFLNSVNGDSYPELVVGAPAVPVTGVKNGTGRVYVLPYDFNNCNANADIFIDAVTGTSMTALLSIDANHPDILTALNGEAANAGFGKFVMGLPDLDGTGDGVAYVYIANTNAIVATSTVVPQYFIFKIVDTSGIGTGPFESHLVKTETGEAGSMLGGYAKVIADINGDGIDEVVISHPGGIGRLGKTGQVRIYSGAGIATTNNANDDLLQMLYNPDPNISNFGISFEYGDITGDGLKDFVIGADQYDTATFQDAGAIYVFPILPIQN